MKVIGFETWDDEEELPVVEPVPETTIGGVFFDEDPDFPSVARPE